MRPKEKTTKDGASAQELNNGPYVQELNKNWINKLEHKGASAEVNYTKKIKLN